jgi:uncharacterized protein
MEKNINQNGICGILSDEKADKDKLILILIHGLGSHKNGKALNPMRDLLNKSNIPYFRIDLFGHGESEGNFKDLTITKAIQSVIHSITYLESLGFKKIGIIGSSFGGLASIFAVIEKNINCLILRSSVIKSQGEIVSKFKEIPIEEWKEKGSIEWIEGKNLSFKFYEDSKKYDALDIANKIKCRTLIIHGNKDHIVPYEDSIEISKKIENSKLVIIENADHKFTEEQNIEMQGNISQFLNMEL